MKKTRSKIKVGVLAVMSPAKWEQVKAEAKSEGIEPKAHVEKLLANTKFTSLQVIEDKDDNTINLMIVGKA